MAGSPVDDVVWQLLPSATTDGGLEPCNRDDIDATLTVMLNATSSSVATSDPADSSSAFQSIDRYVTPLWWTLGIPGNLLAYCVWMQRKMRRSSGIYLASLALNEFLFLVMQVLDNTM